MYSASSFSEEDFKQIKIGVEKCLEKQYLRRFLSNVHGVDYETEEYNKLESGRGSFALMFDYEIGEVFYEEAGWGKNHEGGSLLCLDNNTDIMWEEEVEEHLNRLLEPSFK